MTAESPAPQADAARHADTIREALNYARDLRVESNGTKIGRKRIRESYEPTLAALDALVAAVAAAEQNERHMRNLHDWREKGETEQRERAEAAVARADRLEQALRNIGWSVDDITASSGSADTPEARRLQRIARAALASPAPDRAEAE